MADAHPGGCVDLSVGTPTRSAARRSSSMRWPDRAPSGATRRRSARSASARRPRLAATDRLGVTLDPDQRRRLHRHQGARGRHAPLAAPPPPGPRHGALSRRSATRPTPWGRARRRAPVPVPVDASCRVDLDAIDRRGRRSGAVPVGQHARQPGRRSRRPRRRRGVGSRHDVPVFTDECYVEFTWDGPPRTILEHGPDGVVAVHSLSKRSNLAGARVGFYAGDPELVDYLARGPQARRLHGPGPGAGRGGRGVGRRRARRRAARALPRPRLRRLPQRRWRDLGVEAPLPEGGFYLWAPAPTATRGPWPAAWPRTAGCW